MKLNKIEAVTATTSADIDGKPVESKPVLQARYLKDDGTYHRCSLEVGADLSALPNLTDAEKALVQSAADEVAKIPVDSDISALHFYPAPTQAVFAADPSGKVAADGVVDEPRFGMIGIRNRHKAIPDALVAPCFKCSETGEIKDTDLTKLPPDAQGFANAIYSHRDGIYKEIVKLKSLEDEPDYQETKTVEVIEDQVEIIDGKAIVKKVPKQKEEPIFDDLPCVDENGDGICDVCKTTHKKFPITEPMTVKVPRMIEGKKVSKKDKKRLKELLGKI